MPWFNLNFSHRTARNYMRLYQEREKLKTTPVTDLRSAYKLLAHNELDDTPRWIDPKTVKRRKRKKSIRSRTTLLSRTGKGWTWEKVARN
jgi:hypothetical protein